MSGVPVDEPGGEAPQEELARGGPGVEPKPQDVLREDRAEDQALLEGHGQGKGQ